MAETSSKTSRKGEKAAIPDEPNFGREHRNHAGRDSPIWASIRRDYETTNASLRVLAVRYGLSSHTTIRRRRDGEGWVRDLDAINAGLITQAVVQTTQTSRSVVHPACERREGDVDEKSWAGDGPAGSVYSDGHIGAGTRDFDKEPDLCTFLAELEGEMEAAERGHNGQTGLLVHNREAKCDDQDRTCVKLPESLAELQIRVIQENLQQADRLALMGEYMMDALTLYLKSQTSEQRYERGAVLLLGEKDSLSSLTTAVANVVDKAAGIKRRAVGLDHQTQPKEPDTEVRHTPAYVEEMLSRLPKEALFQLRQVTLEMSRTRSSDKGA